MIRSWIRGRP